MCVVSVHLVDLLPFAGYGQISPVTAGGQAFCCVFALLGIPIAGVLLIKLADILKSGFNRLRDSLLERVPKNPLFSDSTAPLYIALVGVVIFMFIPAVVFFAIEDWTYGQSLYYCFITLSTIGFGDFVPAQSSDDNRIIYKLLTMVWVFVGLAFLTLLLEIVNDLFSTTVVSCRQSHCSLDSGLVSSPVVHGIHCYFLHSSCNSTRCSCFFLTSCIKLISWV